MNVVEPAQLGADRRQIVAAGQVDADADGVAEALGGRAAVALHDDAVQAQQGAAVDGAGVDLLAHGLERRHGDQRAHLGLDAGGQSLFQQGRDEPGRALGGLERDIAGEAVGDDHVDRALGDVIALDEAVIGRSRPPALRI
jgi:hypothetical protein